MSDDESCADKAISNIHKAFTSWKMKHPLLQFWVNEDRHVYFKIYVLIMSFGNALIAWMIGDSLFNKEYDCKTDQPQDECSDSWSSWGYGMGWSLGLAIMSGKLCVDKLVNEKEPNMKAAACVLCYTLCYLILFVASFARNAEWGKAGMFLVTWIFQEFIVDLFLAYVYVGCCGECEICDCGDSSV